MEAIQRKVALLAKQAGGRGTSPSRDEEGGGGGHSRLAITFEEPSSSGRGRGSPGSEFHQRMHKKDRHQASVKLFREWAVDALGPMSAEPSAAELQAKGQRVQDMERKCAELAARAQRRLEASAHLRTGGTLMLSAAASPPSGAGRNQGGASITSGGGGAARVSLGGASVLGGRMGQDTVWAARETRKERAYQAARNLGQEEAAALRDHGGGYVGPSRRTSSGGSFDSPFAVTGGLLSVSDGRRGQPSYGGGPNRGSQPHPHPQQGRGGIIADPRARRALMDAVFSGALSGGGNLEEEEGEVVTYREGRGGARSRPQSAAVPARGGGGMNSRPGSALSSHHGGGGGARNNKASSSSRGPSLAIDHHPRYNGSSNPASSPSPQLGGGVAERRRQQAEEEREAALLALQKETEALRGQLNEAHAAIESRSETEAQLRETVDLLRARLHGQSQREVENQRRLQQHARLEPVFDRLAEAFSFSSPEQVIDRLEMLEDDRMGSFDQLLQTQEEVAKLQSQLEAAHQRVEGVRTQLQTEHIKGTVRLQQRNEDLNMELDNMEGLNKRLGERQAQLVDLQSAVLDLWSLCQNDPLFLAANDGRPPGFNSPNAPARGKGQQRPASSSSANPAGAAGGGITNGAAVGENKDGGGSNGVYINMMSDTNPSAALALVKEYVVARSPQMASKHYLDVQRVANRVWSHHFRHKPEVRGRVVETFEQLSHMADIMAGKIITTTKTLEESKANEKFLATSLDRAERRRRAVEQELEQRNALLRDMAGVPRKQRPQSAAASAIDAIGPDALMLGMSGNGRGGDEGREGRPPTGSSAYYTATSGPASKSGSTLRPQSARPASSSSSFIGTVSPYHTGNLRGGAGVEEEDAGGTYITQSFRVARDGRGDGPPPPPPVPSTASPMQASSSSLSRNRGSGPQRTSERPDLSTTTIIGGAAPRRPVSARGPAGGGREVQVAARPPGEHWGAFTSSVAPAAGSGAAADVNPRDGIASSVTSQRPWSARPDANVGDRSAATAAAAGAKRGGSGYVGGKQWAPANRTAIEATFLSGG